MSARQLRAIASCLIVCVLVVPRLASAQEQREPSSVGQALKLTFLDPTTYVPALFTYDAAMKDWNTSQTFFQNGFLERNARFTVSGFARDRRRVPFPFPRRHRVSQNDFEQRTERQLTVIALVNAIMHVCRRSKQIM